MHVFSRLQAAIENLNTLASGATAFDPVRRNVELLVSAMRGTALPERSDLKHHLSIITRFYKTHGYIRPAAFVLNEVATSVAVGEELCECLDEIENLGEKFAQAWLDWVTLRPQTPEERAKNITLLRRQINVLHDQATAMATKSPGHFIELSNADLYNHLLSEVQKQGEDAHFTKATHQTRWQELVVMTGQLQAILGLEPATEQMRLETIPLLVQVCEKFHRVAQQLHKRREENGTPRETLKIKDEYDVQDLLHSLLWLFFDDVRAEEWTPSYAGGSSRMDFLLKKEQVVIEVKKTRPSLNAKALGDELIIDIAKYKGHPNCKTLVCFVYDPEDLIQNPRGIESDLNQEGDLPVRVFIRP